MGSDSANGPYRFPHLRIEQFRRQKNYTPPPRRIEGNLPVRNNVKHAVHLSQQFSSAFERAKNAVAAKRRNEQVPGVYLEVVSAPGQGITDLSWAQRGIRLGAIREEKDETQHAALYVPLTASDFFAEKVSAYGNPVSEGKKPSLWEKFDGVETLQPGTLETLWADSRTIPGKADDPIWWELWTWRSQTNILLETARRLELTVSEQRLRFPEVEIRFALAARAQIEQLVERTGAVEEVRRATDTPTFFTTTIRREQNAWVDDLVQRIIAPESNAPAVCLLDGGVAQAHPLLSPALSEADCLTVDFEWGTNDSEPGGHGTNMAGSALYRDLTYPLADKSLVDLTYRLESVKFLPPPGFPATDPRNYGSITQAAVSMIEIHAPERQRVFCMAVTNKDVSGERPSSWSSALDQAASGAMIADRDDEDELGKRRLFVVSAGNIPDASDPDSITDIEEFPAEDPAQAWNVLTVGGFTEKNLIDDPGYENWSPLAEPGDLSPYSRISTDWEHSRTPIKPEIVFEAGNKALSPEQTELLSGLDSLSLLTTNKNFTQESLATLWATSPATAQAAGMAAAIMARHPGFWHETVRALMAHSAEWTPAMLAKLTSSRSKKECIVYARHFGYGVPSLERALASAENDLVLLAERECQPFQRLRSVSGVLKAANFRQIDYYDLPWPVQTLEELGEQEIAAKVTLSYFIEPSPNWASSIMPQRYQSFGLRYALKRPRETDDEFAARVNGLERVADYNTAAPDTGWTFGTNSIAAGSLHCDVWRGPAVELAARGKVAVYPVGGWWRDNVRLRRFNSKTRYSLAISITSADQEVRLYNEIANLVSISNVL